MNLVSMKQLNSLVLLLRMFLMLGIYGGKKFAVRLINVEQRLRRRARLMGLQKFQGEANQDHQRDRNS